VPCAQLLPTSERIHIQDVSSTLQEAQGAAVTTLRLAFSLLADEFFNLQLSYS